MDKKTKSTLISAAIIFICLCLGFAAFAQIFSDNDPTTAAEFAEKYGGSETVYAEILASNDCDYLQGQFDTAYQASEDFSPGTPQHKRATGFMTASNLRMEKIGCYK